MKKIFQNVFSSFKSKHIFKILLSCYYAMYCLNYFLFQVSAKTWIYDIDAGSWTLGPRLKTMRRDHGCFPIKHNNTVTNVVVTGGIIRRSYRESPTVLSSTEILNVKTMTWENGPNLPIQILKIEELKVSLILILDFQLVVKHQHIQVISEKKSTA